MTKIRPTIFKDRLSPYKLLAYLLYSPALSADHVWEEGKWLRFQPDGNLMINTGECARCMNMKSDKLWEALYWLHDNQLAKVERTRKRGEAIITLLPPTNLPSKASI